MWGLEESGFADMWGVSGSALGSGSGNFNTTDAENTTFSCAARNTQGPVELPYSTVLVTTIRAIQSSFFTIMLLLGISLNTLVVVTIAAHKKLHTLPFGFALQIVIFHLLISLLAYLGGLTSSVANRWLFGEHACIVAGILFYIATVVRTLLMLVFVIDRFLGVFMPFRYPKHRSRVVAILSVISWILPMALSITSIPPLLDCYEFNKFFWICVYTTECNSNCSLHGNIIFGTVTLPATTIPVILYIALYMKARSIKKNIPGLKNDWKATVTFFMMFISVFLVITPSVAVLHIINRFYQTAEEPPFLYVLSVVSIMILSLLPITDPVVIMRNKDMKEALHEVRVKLMMKYKIKNQESN